MKLFTAIALFLFAFTAHSQTANPDYDKALAEKLGADDYGMKKYVLAILKSGTNTTADQATINTLFRGHMDNIAKMAAQGQLVVAGPMQKNDKNYRGIYIFNVKTIEEAQQLLVNDPAIVAKLLDAELYIWYGSAALPEYLESHKKIEKKKP